MPVRVLVTGANSTVAQSIIKALKASPLDLEIYACDINPYSPGLYRTHKAFLVTPFKDPDYEKQMLALLRSQRIDVLLPGVEVELQALAERREAWEEATGTRIIVNSRELLDITQDKYLTARFLGAHGCSAPLSSVDTSEAGLSAMIAKAGFPLLVKPRRGSASRDVFVVADLAALRIAVQRVTAPVIQEYLGTPEEEYTCGVFVDRHGQLKGIATLKRVLANGITGTAIIGDYPDVESEVRRIVAALKPRGSCNIQLRLNREGRPTAFEINARFSSSVSIRAHFGFNEAEATIRSFVLGEEVPHMVCRPGTAMRYVNEVYVEAPEMRKFLAGQHQTPQAVLEANF